MNRAPIVVEVPEPRSGKVMTTILAQSGPVLIRWSDRFRDGHEMIRVTFRGVAIAVSNGAGIWEAKLIHCRRESPESVLERSGRQWLAGEIKGAWRP